MNCNVVENCDTVTGSSTVWFNVSVTGCMSQGIEEIDFTAGGWRKDPEPRDGEWTEGFLDHGNVYIYIYI